MIVFVSRDNMKHFSDAEFSASSSIVRITLPESVYQTNVLWCVQCTNFYGSEAFSHSIIIIYTDSIHHSIFYPSIWIFSVVWDLRSKCCEILIGFIFSRLLYTLWITYNYPHSIEGFWSRWSKREYFFIFSADTTVPTQNWKWNIFAFVFLIQPKYPHIQ